jgi:hypothetical protein
MENFGRHYGSVGRVDCRFSSFPSFQKEVSHFAAHLPAIFQAQHLQIFQINVKFCLEFITLFTVASVAGC